MKQTIKEAGTIKNKLNGMCPHAQDPYGDCYCFEIRSQQNIRRVFNYCLKIYEECELYQRHLEEEGHAKSDCC